MYTTSLIKPLKPYLKMSFSLPLYLENLETLVKNNAISSNNEGLAANILFIKEALKSLDFDIEIGVDSWSWKSADQEYQQLPYPKLQGRHQFDNAAGVIAALQQLPKNLLVSKAAIADGLQTSELPGRFEQVQGQSGYQMFFDVAHNPHAAQALIENLRALPEAPLHVVLGILADKDSAGLISTLAPLVSSWHVSAAEVERALPGEDLAQLIKDLDPDADVACYDSLLQAYKALDKAMVGSDRLLVTGSFHTVDEVRRLVT